MLISRIEIENLLSFKSLDLELRPLNVLVGPNASGKSNLIRSLDLVRALPKRELGQVMAETGGPRFWINRRSAGVARIYVEGTPDLPFDYSVFLSGIRPILGHPSRGSTRGLHPSRICPRFKRFAKGTQMVRSEPRSLGGSHDHFCKRDGFAISADLARRLDSTAGVLR